MTSPPRRPQDALPPLLPGSARRLVRLDVLRSAQEDGRRSVEVVATARDEVGTPDGPVLLAHAEVRVCAVDGQVASVACTPALDLDAAVGKPVTVGFRRTARAALEVAARSGALLDQHSPLGPSPLAALLDDVPVVVLVAGYLDVRAGLLGTGAGAPLADVCSGWRSGGAPLERALRTGVVPVSELTPAPQYGPVPSLPPLPAAALRRLRWVAVSVSPWGGPAAVTAGFRDSGRDDEGPEGVLHEYSLTASLDDGGRLDTLAASPHVLPFVTCLAAVPGVAALDGRAAADVAQHVPQVLSGTLGCTHLNDLLRALTCTPRLAAAAHAAAGRPTPAVAGQVG